MPANKGVTAALDLIAKEPSKVLGLTIGGHKIEKPGQFVPKADAQMPPVMSFKLPDPSAKYLVISLDLDAPFQYFAVLGPILHWIQPGLTAGTEADAELQHELRQRQEEGQATRLETVEPFIANYIGPAPPPLSGPHRYAFFLYAQPEGLNVKKFAPTAGAEYPLLSRMFTSLDHWVNQLGLGELLAFNYFTSN